MNNTLPNSTATAGRSAHPIMIIAAIAVTLFALTGIAAIMGWIPTSTGSQAPAASAQLAQTTPATAKAEAAKPVTRSTSAQRSETRPVAQSAPAPRSAPVRAEPMAAPAPVKVAQATPAKPVCTDCGVIESVRQIEKKGEGSGLGAAAGGVLGGVLGHQVGGGRGRDVMTVVGAVGGAVAGHQVEKNMKKTVSYEITVRFDDGSTRTVQQDSAPAWRPGDKVRMVNSEIVSNG